MSRLGDDDDDWVGRLSPDGDTSEEPSMDKVDDRWLTKLDRLRGRPAELRRDIVGTELSLLPFARELGDRLIVWVTWV